MSLFTVEEICKHTMEDRSDLMHELFDHHSEHISVRCIGPVLMRKQGTTRYVVKAATKIERELNGRRMYFIDIEE